VVAAEAQKVGSQAGERAARPGGAGSPTYAFIILAHKKPEQVARLLRALATPEAAFYVHIDAQADIAPFEAAVAGTGSGNVSFVKRERSCWGSMGGVRGILNAMAEIEKSPSIQSAHTLSGQDYPLRSSAEIAAFFKKNKDKSFVWSVPMPWANWSGHGGMDRLTKYHVQFFRSRRVQAVCNRVLGVLARVLPRRKWPADLKPYGGSNWFGVSRPALEYILEFVRTRPEYLKFHRFTLSPDENFFQTILLNATDASVREGVVDRCLTYREWPEQGPGPTVLTEASLEDMLKSDCLFARKFDMVESPGVLDLLDEKAKEGSA
jgi:hypothetical protein